MGIEYNDDDLDNEQNIHLGYFENYISYLSNELNINLTDRAKLANINIYKSLMKVKWADFESQIKGMYDIIKVLKDDYFIKIFLNNNKDDICNWEIFVIPYFNENWYIVKVVFIKKKDKLWNCKQEIKVFVDWIFQWKLLPWHK